MAGTAPVSLGGTGEWKTATIRLPRASLSNQQNGSADLRIANECGTLAVSKIVLARPKP